MIYPTEPWSGWHIFLRCVVIIFFLIYGYYPFSIFSIYMNEFLSTNRQSMEHITWIELVAVKIIRYEGWIYVIKLSVFELFTNDLRLWIDCSDISCWYLWKTAMFCSHCHVIYFKCWKWFNDNTRTKKHCMIRQWRGWNIICRVNMVIVETFITEVLKDVG